MAKKFEYNDDLDDDYDDDDFDELEEIEDDNEDEPSVGADSSSSEEELEELDDEDTGSFRTLDADDDFSPAQARQEEEVEEAEEDDDAAFFDSGADEDDDLGLGEIDYPSPTGEAARPLPPDVSEAPPETPKARRPLPKQQKFPMIAVILPALGILLGVGFFLFKGGESPVAPPPVPKIEDTGQPKEKPADIPAKETAKEWEYEYKVPDDYVELKRVELVDAGKIDSLIVRGFLKGNPDGSGQALKKLVLILYKTGARYVVSQTYHYSSGKPWTVETHFSDITVDEQDVLKAFDSMYAG